MLSEGIALLSPDVRALVHERIEALRDRSRPVVCPLLDRQTGACLVYAHRPSACRTYGFYVRRQDGMHCTIVEEAVSAHKADVVWGNHASIDHALAVSFGAELSSGGSGGVPRWGRAESPSPSSSI